MKNMKTQSGNILFLILIAIALLGALTVLMTRTGSQSDDTGDTEQATIAASKAFRDMQGIAAGFQSLLSRGLGENQISFENMEFTRYDGTPIQGIGSNPNCTVDDCKLFNPAGAGLKPTYTPKSIRSEPTTYTPGNWKAGAMALEQYRKHDIGTAKSDVFVTALRFTKEGCMAFNRIAKVENPLNAPPNLTVSAALMANGTFNDTGSGEIDNSNTALNGKKSFCVFYTTDAAYHAFHLVHAR